MTAVDVVVVGGGPAGACTAGRLAREGAEVLLVEGKRFPRHHIGESLLGVSMSLLEEWGLVDRLHEEGFLRKPGAVFVWGGDDVPLELDMAPPGYAFQVLRSRFDEILLEHACADGVRLLAEHRAKDLLLDDDRVAGVRVASPDGRSWPVTARHVVDASGLFQFVPRKLRLPVDVRGPRRAAVSAYFRGAGRVDPPWHHAILSEACEDGWIWFIPLSDDLTSVGWVGDESDLVDDPTELLTGQLATSSLARRLLDGASLTERPRVLKYTNHLVGDDLWGDGFVLVGDSAFFVDPLFSTGVHGALYSGTLAAAALTSVLAGDVDEAEAAAWYADRIDEHYHRIEATVLLLYGIHPGTGGFWRRRDLMGIGDDDAEALCRTLGVGGMAFFISALRSDGLSLPPAVARRVPEFAVPLPPGRRPDVALAAGDVVHLAPEVTAAPDLVRQGGRLVRGIVLRHLRNRALPLDTPLDSPGGRLLAAVGDGRTVAEVLSAAGVPAADAARSAAFLATLVDNRLLAVSSAGDPVAPVPSTAGATS